MRYGVVLNEKSVTSFCEYDIRAIRAYIRHNIFRTSYLVVSNQRFTRARTILRIKETRVYGERPYLLPPSTCLSSLRSHPVTCTIDPVGSCIHDHVTSISSPARSRVSRPLRPSSLCTLKQIHGRLCRQFSPTVTSQLFDLLTLLYESLVLRT